MTRTDVHRPSVIVPSDYQHILSFAYLNIAQGDTSGFQQFIKPLRTLGESMSPPWGEFFSKNETGGCDICGANYIYGDVFKHVPSGEYIRIGWICADDMHMRGNTLARTSLRRDRERLMREGRATSKAAKKRAKFAQFIDTLPELKAAITAAKARTERHPCRAHGDASCFDFECRSEMRVSRGWHIVVDIAGKGNRYGSISEKQVALCLKIHREEVQREEERAAQPEEVKAQAPEGRQTVSGKCVATKQVDTDYGSTMKMLVKVTLEDGSVWKCWGTQAASLDAVAKGRAVEFTATLKRSDRDSDFAFFSRPTKARFTDAAPTA